MWHVDRTYKEYYESPDFPIRQFISLGRKVRRHKGPDVRVWKFDIRGLLFDPIDGIFGGICAWDASVFPSWGSAFRTLWDNVCQGLTPWYHPRRCLINSLVNDNGMKYLSGNRKSAMLRTRGEDCSYFEVSCGLVSATARVIRFVEPDTGKGRCTFIVGSEGTRKEERVVACGPCLTWRQCDRLFTRIMINSPELGWYNRKEKKNEVEDKGNAVK